MNENYEWRNSIKGLPQKKNHLYQNNKLPLINKLFKNFSILVLICLFINTQSFAETATIGAVTTTSSIILSIKEDASSSTPLNELEPVLPTFCSAAISQGTLVPTGDFQQTASVSSGATHYWAVSLTAGTSYTFSNCVDDGGTFEDTILILYHGTEYVSSEDDTCLINPSITYTPIESGLYYIYLAHYDCGNLVANQKISYRDNLIGLNPCLSTTALNGYNVNNTAELSGPGVYNNNACNYSTPGLEKIFTFTPTVTGQHTINQQSSVSWVDYMYKPASNGCSSEGWLCIGDLYEIGVSSTFSLTSGIEYYIMLDSESTSGGGVVFNISVDEPEPTFPSNNDCGEAIALSCGDSVAGTTIGATDSGLGSPSCSGGTPNDVFYTLNVVAGNEYTISVNGDDYDAVIVLYSGTCDGLSEVDCADNGFSAGVAESTTFTATETETILIRTYDWSSSQGSFTISVACSSSCTPMNWYADNDGDGYGTDASLVEACDAPATNYVLLTGDCDDANGAINPGAFEFCWNNIDDNCDGALSEDCTPIVVNMDTPSGFMIPTMATHIRAFAYDYPGVKQYRFSITNTTTGITVEVIRPTKYVTIPAAISNFSTSYTVRASAVVNGELVPYAGNIITVTTPSVATVKLHSSVCGVTLNSLGQTIRSTWGQNATSYTFRARVANVGPASPASIDYFYTAAQSNVYTSMNAFAGLVPQYGASYAISVSFDYVDIATGDTVSSGYGDECLVKMPSIPTIGLISPMCGSTLSTKGQTIIAAHTTGASAYQLQVRETGGSIYYENAASASPYSNLMSFPGLTIADGTSYSISARVQVMIDGVPTWSAYGAECVLITPSAMLLRTIDVPFTAVAYPNPFTNSFLLDVKSSNTSNVDITVYDMLGRLVEQRQVSANELETTTIGSNYPAGIYNVVIAQDTDTKTVRVIKR